VDGPGPSGSELLNGQVEQLVDSIIGGKDAMGLRDFAQGTIDGFNGVRRVNDAADHFRKGKERDHTIPMSPPGPTNGGGLPVPFLCEQL